MWFGQRNVSANIHSHHGNYIYATIWLDEGSILDRNSPISQCQNAISNNESSSSPAGYWIIPPLSQDWKDAWQRNALLRTLISCNSSVPLECFLCGFTGWYIQVMTDLVRVWLYRCVLMQQGSIKFKTSSTPLWFSYQKTLVGLILDSPKNGLKLICESPNEVHVNTNYGIVWVCFTYKMWIE